MGCSEHGGEPSFDPVLGLVLARRYHSLTVASEAQPRRPILILDNKDSFVWNLAQAFMVLGKEVEVRRSDQISLPEISDLGPQALVLSPGPGRPENAGICVQAVQELSGSLPILGVCLGHQAIAQAYGATIQRSAPCHGKPWPIQHDQQALFANLPNPLTACRYHSLVVEASLPSSLKTTAWSKEGLCMALQHQSHPTFGLQFHPESFRTPLGSLLLQNFLQVST